MATFSFALLLLLLFFGCGAVRSTTTAEPSDLPLKWLSFRLSSLQLTWPGGMSARALGGLSADKVNPKCNNTTLSSIVNGLSYEQRTKKLMSQWNTITVTVNRKNHDKLEDVRFRQEIRRKPHSLSR